MATKTLFVLPIISVGSAPPSNGTIVCTTSSPGVYLLSFSSPPDNRLTTSFCQTFLLALDIIENSHPIGVVITTSAIGKFYSNGLDLEHASTVKGFWNDSLFKLWKRLLTYPMPTVALINGHAFAGGLMTAMFHDYRIFNPSRGFLCLNELDFGAALKPAMSSIFRQKVPYPAVYRSLVLEAKRFGAKGALEGGIVDGLGGLEEAIALISERKLVEKGKSGVYGVLKAEMYRETLGYLDDTDDKGVEEYRRAEDERREQLKSRVQEWEKNATKAKL